MAKIKAPKDPKELPQAIVKQMLALATSGFGLVAALAWNEFIKEAVSVFIKPYLPEGSTVISLLIYAIIVTGLAVIVTLQLTRIQSLLEREKVKK
jgi:hypothetical protein